MTPNEVYWSRRAKAETKAALACNDPHVASLHVDLATRCVKEIVSAREKGADPAGQ